ncbi:MAG TPA: MFS transporter [Candidatus Angelobacter sp.]|nr:MFS transporter [Candidatus Angelobacter sp.]
MCADNTATLNPKPSRAAFIAVAIAGICTFLNIYCTQPLLPFFQKVFHASEIQVSLTVSAVILAVALAAPFTGMLAETFGRKQVIVPALFAMTVPTFLTATSPNLAALIAWRFAYGIFVPGVIVVMMAYITEEFAGRAGVVMAAYVAATVFGGFLGRFIVGLLATHANWRLGFVILGVLDLFGAIAVARWLPPSVHFVRATHVFRSFRDTWSHLRNPRLLAICAMGFTILFSLVGAFTYANFYLARPPFNLTPAGLGSIFFVYLFGCVVTPWAGHFLDRHGFRQTTGLSACICLLGLLLTLVHSLPVVIIGLAIFSSGIFVAQAAASVLTGEVAGRARSTAAGLYVTFYYAGGSVGVAATGWFWLRGGWPECIELFVLISVITFILAQFGGKKISTIEASQSHMDTAI